MISSAAAPAADRTAGDAVREDADAPVQAAIQKAFSKLTAASDTSASAAASDSPRSHSNSFDDRPVHDITLSLVLTALGDSLLGGAMSEALGLPPGRARELARAQLVASAGLADEGASA